MDTRQPLHANAVPKRRKPLLVWKVGVICGILSAIAVVLGETGVLGHYISYLVPFILFTVIAQFLIAAFGGRKEHFTRIWASSFVVVMFTLGIHQFYLWTGSDKAFTFYEFGVVLAIFFGHWLLTLVTALLFWFVPGKMDYFRNRVQETEK